MRLAIALPVVALVAGCTRHPPESTPEGALRLWLERMEAASESPAASKGVYELLGKETRAELEQRAHRATQLFPGRRVEPWEMLATGWFGLRFRPHAMRTHISGDHASVDVEGASPATEHAVVQLVREGAAWKVELGGPTMETR